MVIAKDNSFYEGRLFLVDNGASSYRRFLEGDDNGITEIVTEYKDGLILYLNSYVNNISIAEELMEDTFFKLIIKKPMFFNRYSFKTSAF